MNKYNLINKSDKEIEKEIESLNTEQYKKTHSHISCLRSELKARANYRKLLKGE